jgi:hypothetical protein
MNNSYESQLRILRDEIENGGAKPSAVDDAVSKLFAMNDVRMPADLLALLFDEAEYDEAMFSLIHAAESVDDPSYVRAMLSAFAKLAASAPRWASIVLMRVLNNDATRHEIVTQLKNASPTVKEPIRLICMKINQVSPEFLAKTASIMVASAPATLRPVK